MLTPLSWAAPGGVGCCGSHTGAVNSRMAGWLPPTAVGCHKCCKKRRCWGDGDKPHIWAGCVVWLRWQPWAAHSPQAALWVCSGFSWLPALLCPHPALAMVTPPPQELLISIVWSLWKLCRICPRMSCVVRWHCHLSQLDRTRVSRLNTLKPRKQAEGAGRRACPSPASMWTTLPG